MKFQSNLVADARTAHGEGSWWDVKQQRLLWLDCTGGAIHRYDPVTNVDERIVVPFLPMTIAPCETYGYVCATPDRVLRLDDDFNIVREICVVKHPLEGMRFNDGKCDPAGRLLVGSMSMRGVMDAGTLYRIELDGTAVPVVENVAISNGVCWHGDQMYYTDTFHGSIYAFDYDVATGKATNRRVLFHEDGVQPDGMCVDAAGNLYSALWGSFKAVCIDTKTGKVQDEFYADVPFVSSVCFGGEDLKTLFLTSSRLDMAADALDQYRTSGALYSVKTDREGALLFRGKYE